VPRLVPAYCGAGGEISRSPGRPGPGLASTAASRAPGALTVRPCRPEQLNGERGAPKLSGHPITTSVTILTTMVGGLPNVLRLSCKARLVMLALSYPTGRALPAPNAG
jgi:hypothetical protein